MLVTDTAADNVDLSVYTKIYYVGGVTHDTDCEGTTAKPCKSLSAIKNLDSSVKYMRIIVSGTGDNGWMISPDKTVGTDHTTPVELKVTTVITSNGEENECYVY